MVVLLCFLPVGFSAASLMAVKFKQLEITVVEQLLLVPEMVFGNAFQWNKGVDHKQGTTVGFTESLSG